MSAVWSQIDQLDNVVPADVQTELLLLGRRLVERSTRWLLRHRRHPIDVATILADYGTLIGGAADAIETERSDEQRRNQELNEERLAGLGVPVELAQASVAHDRMVRCLDIIETARAIGCSVAEAASVWFQLERHLGLDWLHLAISALPRVERWESLARSALRDELSQSHAELARTVVRHAVDATGGVAGAAVETWLGRHRLAVRRLDELRNAVGDPGLEALTVLLREVRSLAAE